MPNSVEISTAGGKRDRLVSAATELLHEHGVEATTLAQIAEAADVPPGNVYYYFKTRDELVGAVIDARAQSVRELLSSLDSRANPRARLKGLAHSWIDAADSVAAHGCPLGSLCSELNKSGDGLDRRAEELFTLLLDWAEAQFRELGVSRPGDQALTLISGVQGAAVLANTLRDSRILSKEVRRLERWIDSL
jgi:TetR/AcrR family transcriptional regulator, transcriptional repressor for nem operon